MSLKQAQMSLQRVYQVKWMDEENESLTREEGEEGSLKPSATKILFDICKNLFFLVRLQTLPFDLLCYIEILVQYRHF